MVVVEMEKKKVWVYTEAGEVKEEISVDKMEGRVTGVVHKGGKYYVGFQRIALIGGNIIRSRTQELLILKTLR